MKFDLTENDVQIIIKCLDTECRAQGIQAAQYCADLHKKLVEQFEIENKNEPKIRDIRPEE